MGHLGSFPNSKRKKARFENVILLLFMYIYNVHIFIFVNKMQGHIAECGACNAIAAVLELAHRIDFWEPLLESWAWH